MKKILGAMVLTSLVAVSPVFSQNSPEEAVKLYKTAIEKGQASEVLALLPPSYVKDATGLVNDFAGRMDADIWNKLRGTIGNAATSLAPKAALFVEMAGEGEVLTAEVKAARAKAIGAAMTAAGALAKNEVLGLDRLKTVDAATFAKEISAMFASSTAAFNALNSEEGKPAVPEIKILKSEKLDSGNWNLTFADEDGEEDETVEFKQVEGRWVPAEMADGWAESIQNAREGLKKLNFTTPEGLQQKAQIMMMMNMVDPMIQQFATAESAEQLQQMLGGLMMPLMMMGGAMGGGM